MPKSALSIVKEYKETPFEMWNLRNKQITIIEDLPKSKNIREKIEHNEKYNKNQTYYYIKVQEGLFEKDMKLTENQLTQLFLVLPQDMMNFKGAILTVIQDGLNREFSYVGRSPEGMNENFPSNATEQPAKPEMPRQLNDYAVMLWEAVKFNENLGVKVPYPVLQTMADKIYPNHALDVITAAKTAGYITEHADGFRGH